MWIYNTLCIDHIYFPSENFTHLQLKASPAQPQPLLLGSEHQPLSLCQSNTGALTWAAVCRPSETTMIFAGITTRWWRQQQTPSAAGTPKASSTSHSKRCRSGSPWEGRNPGTDNGTSTFGRGQTQTHSKIKFILWLMSFGHLIVPHGFRFTAQIKV